MRFAYRESVKSQLAVTSDDFLQELRKREIAEKAAFLATLDVLSQIFNIYVPTHIRKEP